ERHRRLRGPAAAGQHRRRGTAGPRGGALQRLPRGPAGGLSPGRRCPCQRAPAPGRLLPRPRRSRVTAHGWLGGWGVGWFRATAQPPNHLTTEPPDGSGRGPLMSWIERTAVEMLDALGKGAVTAEALTGEFLQAIRQRDPRVKAFLHVNDQSALDQARAVD